MKKVLFVFLILFFGFTIISCSEEEEEYGEKEYPENIVSTTDDTTTTDTTAPVIAEVTFVTTPTNDNTPNYTFSSTEAGTISYGGSCSSRTTIAISGNNTITLDSLSDGTYSDCIIAVRGTTGYLSNTLTITTFIVDTTAATLAEVTVVTTPTNDSTPDYTFSSSEAGTITYGGTCSSSTTSATTDNNTITLVSLSDGTYSNCTITVTDNSSNSVTLNINSFVIDTTAPTVSSISPTDNQSGVSISDNISVTFSESMDNTSVTTNTDNTTCYGSFALSSDNFSSCVQMSSSPTSSNSDKTFTLDPYDNLSGASNYKIRVTTGVKDTAGNTLSSQYDNSTGFTTTSSSTQMGGSIQGNELSLSTAVTTLAGSSAGSTDHNTGTSASFNYPNGITTDGTNLYVADASNHRIRKIVISTGVVTTLAGSSLGSTDATGTSARFSAPEGITTDGTNLYVADVNNNRIRKIVISTGVVTTLAGSSQGSTDATGTSSSFYSPRAITTDGTNLYVADNRNHRIRKIVISTGVVTTLAGNSLGSTDATGTSASFNYPRGITTDGTNLYVADNGNHRIRKIVISTGVVTTLAGSSQGSSDATGTSASFNYPKGITTDGTNLYVTDTNNHRIRKIVISTGVVTTLAGNSYGNTDATGTSASFNSPMGITTDGTNLYVTDTNNHRIRKIQ